MAEPPESKPSFTPYRRWATALHVGLVIAVVLAVVVMVNYLSADYFARFHVSTQHKVKLFPRTVKFLQSLTNSVQETMYYDKEEPFYSTLLEWLNEYKWANPTTSLRAVDYTPSPGAAQVLTTKYGLLNATHAE